MEAETVYNAQDDSHIVMSEKVQSLAGTIYQEFERMISKYDEDVVKDLMPLVVNILECLDMAYTENQEHEVEVELLREDNEQLVTQYEREKQLRKVTEQKVLELEDVVEEDKRHYQTKVESLESIVRMFELKTRNASDHANRMEEKADELKKEFTKLHERYTELFKTHMDYMERTKILYGTDRLDQLGSARGRAPMMQMNNFNRSSGPVSYGFSSLDPNRSISSTLNTTDGDMDIGPMSDIQNELQEAQLGSSANQNQMDHSPMADAGQDTGGGWVDGFSEDNEEIQPDSPEVIFVEDISPGEDFGSEIERKKVRRSSSTTKEERTGNTLYQELQFQEPEALAEVDETAEITVTDNFYGMGKEVENLILENTELLTTKNALNIVKDDLIARVDELTSEHEILREEITSLNAVKSRLRLRVQELEDELKKFKDDFEKKGNQLKSDDEEDVPMAQRKRFTRVEMARVLMERNQYKERFMELQEAVRWTEMIRASKNDPEADQKSKQTIWKFFSNLFSTSERPLRKPIPYGNFRYNAPLNQVAPAIDTMRRRNIIDHRKRGLEFFESEVSSEKLQQRRANERREQYKQVRAHVKKDDGRMQAYGWSLPAKPSVPSDAPKENAEEAPVQNQSKSSHIPVPVPVYCRPLMEKEPGMKIWCAAGVNLTGGRTKDGGSVFGASVFYGRDPEGEASPSPNDKSAEELDKLDKELKANERERIEGETLEVSLSSLSWICTSTHSISKVTVIDANNPADILESFHVCSSHLLCIASVPGAKESDYSMDEDMNKIIEQSQEFQRHKKRKQQSMTVPVGEGEAVEPKSQEDPGLCFSDVGTLTFINCGTGVESSAEDGKSSPKESEMEDIVPVLSKEVIESTNPDDDNDRADLEKGDVCSVPKRRLVKEPEGVIKDGVADVLQPLDESNVVQEEMEKMSSVLATMWLGSQSGSIYVHSAVRHWKRCLHSIKLKDSILSIVHLKGRVLAALADGTVAIFHRKGDCQWDLTNYHLLDLGRPHHSIRCMHVVHSKVWCGYRNKVHVVNPKTMCVEETFDAHPRKESQVRQMAWIGEGVWVSIRLDSTLRLFHAHTHQHLQDVDIEPYVSKMLGTGKLGFSFVRITALLISSNRLWIGTGNGVIISVPLAENYGSVNASTAARGSIAEDAPRSLPFSGSQHAPGSAIRVYSDAENNVTAGSSIPFCSMAQAQLSFHGHRDAVKFFVAVPGSGSYPAFAAGGPSTSSASGALGEESDSGRPKSMLVISGGEGYIDFRLAEDSDEDRDSASHLLVWHLPIEDILGTAGHRGPEGTRSDSTAVSKNGLAD